MENNDVFHNLKLAEKVRYRTYKLMGIKDKNLIRQLISLDNLYVTHLYLHRKNVDETIESLRDEISTDELDGES